MKIRPATIMIAAALAAFAPRAGAEVTVTITNTQDAPRHQVVEIDAPQALSMGGEMRAVNALGQDIPYQIAHDGKILVEVSVRPLGEAKITLKPGAPGQFKSYCHGRQFPERLDDLAWENDRCAYRCYGPALQRTGERAFGIDVWLKSTPEPVVEARYQMETGNGPLIEEAKKISPEAADSLYRLISYHYDHGDGLDCYKVGPSLGCGAPALMRGDTLLFPRCYDSCKILDNGPLRFTVELTFPPTDDGIVEHRVISLDKGSNFNKITVWYDGLTRPAALAAGVVIHTEDTLSVALGENYVHYADPTDNPAGQNSQIYVAAVFPHGVTSTRTLPAGHPESGVAGHAVGIVDGYTGQKYTYYAGATWSKYDCRSQSEWQLRIEALLSAIAAPLLVTAE